MSTELLRKLQALSPDIARVFLNLTRDDPTAVIDADGVGQFFGQAVDDKKVTPKELDALIFIFNRDSRLFTDGAVKFATGVFWDRNFVEPLAMANGTLLDKDADLAKIYAALDLAGNNGSQFQTGSLA